MKYFIELGFRGNGVQLIDLTEEEKNQLLLEENLDDIYYEWVDNCGYNFELENIYLTPCVDRYSLTIRDEKDNVVYESDNFNDLIDTTYDENGELHIKDWIFKGVKDGFYLTRIQTIKGCSYIGKFELNEPFDKNKLYVVQDQIIDDELLGDSVYPVIIYYQRGEGYDMKRDIINLDLEGDCGEQYWETHLFKLTNMYEWENLKE